MFVFESKLFGPIHDKVLLPAIINNPVDTQSALASSKAKVSQFKLKNPEKLERELEIEELRKHIKHIKRVKRYVRVKIDEMERTVQSQR
jgi:hypothetical protein